VKRSAFMTLLGGAAAWPLAVRAQQPKLPTIDYLGADTPSAEGLLFVQRLRKLAWIEGRTVAIEVR
jgi:putative ABC transport system substrate-binding protein